MNLQTWLVIGISGVTCGGKTTLASRLSKILPNSKIVSQDEYYLTEDDERHIWIPELNHINFDILSSLDMDRMLQEVKKIIDSEEKIKETRTNDGIKSRNERKENSLDEMKNDIISILRNKEIGVLIIEGFSIFSCRPIEKLCNLKYFLTLEKTECYSRRQKRVYEPPDCPGYFEKCVWPEHTKQLEYLQEYVKNVTYINGNVEDLIRIVLNDLLINLT